ncbi:MAG: conserved rane protein of unknown function [Chthoniobacteraceae bacterium]|nr:conserved rane protein of unknown function [Chthoniobacteraceae bacterium]
MSSEGKQTGEWKQRFTRELVEYWTNAAYLAFFFSAFTTYRRLILAEYEIDYSQYGAGLIEALILAKVILIGNALHLGREQENKPLIFSTLYKAFVFTVFVGIFEILEHTFLGWWHGKGLMGGIVELRTNGIYVFWAKCIVTFSVFIPFFAFSELGRVLGRGKLSDLFFRGKTDTNPPGDRSSRGPV